MSLFDTGEFDLSLPGDKPQVQKGGGFFNNKMVLIVVVILVIIGGGYYYFKVYKPKQESCTLHDEKTKRVYNVEHNSSTEDYNLINVKDSDSENSFQNATSDGYEYAKIPDFSGDVLYTINITNVDNREDVYNANFTNVETGERPILDEETNYEIHVYKPCEMIYDDERE